MVDDHGVAVGTFTASNLRGVSRETLKLLLLPVLNYIAATTGKRIQLIACSPTEKVSSVLRKLANRGIHRVWILDKMGKPIGVVRQHDILEVALQLSLGRLEGEM